MSTTIAAPTCADCAGPAYPEGEGPYVPGRPRARCEACAQVHRRRRDRARDARRNPTGPDARTSEAERGKPPIDHGPGRSCPCGARLSRWNPGPDCHGCERSMGILRVTGDRCAAGEGW